ncbi:MAG TPA: hypothetical protein VEC35_08115 [Noviherbaspirillum sp.]|nr:hypothetical protein [Noviherbaspirillum sp.]
MSTIIAGRFQQQTQVEHTIEELVRAGVGRDRISAFYVNPPGQHDHYALGGDHAISAGAHESIKGVATGAVTGAAVGLAATPFLGPVGAITGGLLGAHVGGLVGSLAKMKEQGETGAHGEDADNAEPVRHSGLLLAVGVGGHDDEDRVADLLRSFGAAEIESAEGTIENGDWVDFDPTAPPHFVQYVPRQTRTAGTRPR